jgi:hypothetical protein
MNRDGYHVVSCAPEALVPFQRFVAHAVCLRLTLYPTTVS